jgi:hypothetical protein
MPCNFPRHHTLLGSLIFTSTAYEARMRRDVRQVRLHLASSFLRAAPCRAEVGRYSTTAEENTQDLIVNCGLKLDDQQG